MSIKRTIAAGLVVLGGAGAVLSAQQISGVRPAIFVGAISGAGQTVQLTTQGFAAVSITIGGPVSATLAIEGTADGTNWNPVGLVPSTGGGAVSSIVLACGTASCGTWQGAAALPFLRVRASAYTSGTAAVNFYGTMAPSFSIAGGGGGGASPGGVNTDLQCNITGAFGACDSTVAQVDPATHILKARSFSADDGGANVAGFVFASLLSQGMFHVGGTFGIKINGQAGNLFFMADHTDSHEGNVLATNRQDAGSPVIPGRGPLLKAQTSNGGAANSVGTNLWLAAGESIGTGLGADVVILPGTTGLTPGTGENPIVETGRFTPNGLVMKTGQSMRVTAVIFANRPAVPVEGMMITVTDSTVNTWGTTITGGGANHVLAYYNGTNWTVAGK